jgi:hypothetical protein
MTVCRTLMGCLLLWTVLGCESREWVTDNPADSEDVDLLRLLILDATGQPVENLYVALLPMQHQIVDSSLVEMDWSLCIDHATEATATDRGLGADSPKPACQRVTADPDAWRAERPANAPGGLWGLSDYMLPAWPNPTLDNSQFYVEYPESADLTVTVQDLWGQVVSQLGPLAIQPGGYNVPLFLAALPAGLYQVDLSVGTLQGRMWVVRDAAYGGAGANGMTNGDGELELPLPRLTGDEATTLTGVLGPAGRYTPAWSLLVSWQGLEIRCPLELTPGEDIVKTLVMPE